MPADLEAILEKFATTIEKQQKTMETLMKKVELCNSNGVSRDSDNEGASGTNAAHTNSQSVPRNTRKEHYLLLFQNLQKSAKLKDYKISSQENVSEWLKRFDLCIENLSKACDIDPATLTRDEYINLIKSRLDLSVLCEMELKFKSLPTATTWEDVTKKDLHKYLIEQFGSKEPDLSTLMKYFGANRPKKSPDTKVKNFFCKWWEELPLCLKPTTEDEREACVSLLQRTLFYHALDDTYLQQKIADIPEFEQTLKAFNEAAQKAESQRHAYRDAAEKSNVLDAASNVSINKFDHNQTQPTGRGGRYKSRGRGRGRAAAAAGTTTTGDGGRVVAPGGGGREYGQSGHQHSATGGSDYHKGGSYGKKSNKKTYPCFHCGATDHTIYKCKKYEATKTGTRKASMDDLDQDDSYSKKVQVIRNPAITDVNGFKVEVSSLSDTEVDTSKDTVSNKSKCVSVNTPISTKTAKSCNHVRVKAVSTSSEILDVDAKLTNVSVKCVDIDTNEISGNSVSAKYVDSVVTNSKESVLTNTNKGDMCDNNMLVTAANDVSIKVVSAEITREPNIMAGVILNGNISCRIELDTAACEPIITYDCYKEIVSKSNGKAPKLQKGTVKMKMVDGTQSTAVKGCINLHIARADMTNRACTTRVVVVDGPHALLGRPVLKALWPEEYAHLTNIAKDSLEALCTNACSVCVTVPRKGVAAHNSTTSVADTPTDDAAAAALQAGDTPTVSQPRQIPPYPTGHITQKIGEAYCHKLCDEVFYELFDGKQGELLDFEAEIQIKEGHEKYLKVQPCAKVPYGIAKEFFEELDKFAETCDKVDGRGLKVASQLVPVVKKKGNEVKVRLCGNYKNTINDHIEDEPYQFTSCNDQMDKLIGTHFTCLDMSGAYEQVVVKPKCRPILTLTTPYGFLQPKRMKYGVKTAPKIFQQNVGGVIQGMDGKGPVPRTACVVDDICTTGSTPEEHFDNLVELLSRLHAAGLKLNKDKCKFYQTEVKFLGKIIDKNGKRLDPSSVDAIVNMPAPTDKQTLRSFLGHMSYISRHIPDIRIARAPLDALLKKDVNFVWEKAHSEAFSNCKKLASNPATLAHYDENLPLVLITDASPVGIAACLAHRVTENGKTYLKPLSYASCSLKPAERNYAQIDREGLAVHWGMRHYRTFIFGKRITLHTDCSALTRIFGPKNDFGGCAIGRLNRWAAELLEFDFTATHIRGTSNKICDSLSRLPVPPKGELLAPTPSQVGQTVSVDELAQSMSVKFTEIDSASEVMDLVTCLAHLPDPKVETVSICKIIGTAPTAVWDVLPLTVKDVAKATREDKVYGKLLSAIRSGDLNKNDADMKPFNSLFEGLYVEQGVIFYGSRIVVPTKQQERLLVELHMTHMGIVKMKEVSRDYFWWPLINKQIEAIAKSCSGCNKYRKRPAPAPLCPWPYARRPMERVHIDYCEFKGKQLLIMIDAYSKYIWTHVMNTDTTALKTLAVLYGWFCERSGFPVTLVSDNGPQFTSQMFAEKMTKWGIKHILTPPYHPASNGLAEKAVDIVKTKLKKMECPASPVELYVNLQAALKSLQSYPTYIYRPDTI